MKVAACLVLMSAVLAPPPASAQAPGSRFDITYLVHSREGRRELPAYVVAGEDMVALADLARLFGLTLQEDAAAGGVTLTRAGQRILLTPGQDMVSVAGRLVSLPAGVTRDARGWLVPVEFISRALALIHDTRLEVRRGSRRILVGDVRVPRVVARYEPAGPGARVTIDVSPAVPHSIVREADRLIVRFEADALDPQLPRLPEGGLVRDVRAMEGPPALSVALDPRVDSFRSTEQPVGESTRVVVNLLPAPETAAAPAPAPAVPEPATPAPATPLPAPFAELAPASAIRTVVIDAGHGGDEEGSRGPGGTLEKDVTLRVARRLGAAFESRLGLRVIYTRTGDQTVRLDERAAIANNNKADLFISLHTNASLSPQASGTEVYFLSLDEYGDAARRIATAEPEVLPVFGGGAREIEVILWEMAQARYIDQSGELARTIERHLRGRVPMSPRAIQQAPFRVLVGANMPAVLIEMGFITNPEQEAQLASDAFQASLVQGIVDAIVAFRDRLEAPASAADESPAVGGADPGGPGGERF